MAGKISKISKQAPPNFRAVEMPGCCLVCVSFAPAGAKYDDSPAECERFDVSPDETWVCDGFERENS